MKGRCQIEDEILEIRKVLTSRELLKMSRLQKNWSGGYKVQFASISQCNKLNKQDSFFHQSKNSICELTSSIITLLL